MYLSDRDIKWTIDKGQLIIEPPSIVSPTSIDLHLDRVEEAQMRQSYTPIRAGEAMSSTLLSKGR